MDLNPFSVISTRCFVDVRSEVSVLVVQRFKTGWALRREHPSEKNCDKKYSPIKLRDSQNDELSFSTFTS